MGTVTVKPNGEMRRAEETAESLSTRELLGRIASETKTLAQKEIALARAELSADIKRQLGSLVAFGVGAVVALCAVTLFFVAVALALAQVMAPWAAALVVTGVLLLAAGIAALIGWRRRVRSPLARTRRHIKNDVSWVRERLA